MVSTPPPTLSAHLKEMKSKSLLESFTAYCRANPDQRFWQALRNWAGWPFIFVAKDYPIGENVIWNGEDTFYWEHANGVTDRS